jgi:hypothetical protein
MKLSGLHFLLTYRCTLMCDHCFVFGSPWQNGVFTLERLVQALDQAAATGSIGAVAFEGGEPFLYYAILLEGVREAARRGFRTTIVTNAYWAESLADASAWLRQLAGILNTLTVSSDPLHWSEQYGRRAAHAAKAAAGLGIGVSGISIARPGAADQPPGAGAVMFRGRAVEKLLPQDGLRAWEDFDRCPHENLAEPGRVHLDPFGNLHLCQGLLLGNLVRRPLAELCAGYRAEEHPIAGPLLMGGPRALALAYDLPHADRYADACHFCYTSRQALRARFPEYLGPDQMYGRS